MILGLFGIKKKMYELRPVNKQDGIWIGKDPKPWKGKARSEAEARIQAHEERMGGAHEFEGNPDDSPWLLKKHSLCHIIEESK